jgi:hypothetical protein
MVKNPQAFDYVRFIGNGKFVHVKRDFPEAIHGYVLAANDQLVLMREFSGFRPGGFVALRKADVRELTLDEKWTEMMASEGFARLANTMPSIRHGSMVELLVSLFERARNLQIECEDCANSPEAGLHIGRITSVSATSISFVFFESSGRWYNTAYEIPLSSVTKVVFDDPYVDTFSKYVGDCPVPRS